MVSGLGVPFLEHLRGLELMCDAFYFVLWAIQKAADGDEVELLSERSEMSQERIFGKETFIPFAIKAKVRVLILVAIALRQIRAKQGPGRSFSVSGGEYGTVGVLPQQELAIL